MKRLLKFVLHSRCSAGQLLSSSRIHQESALQTALMLQVKIAELPLDSFRMLQALEWEDQYSSPNPPAQEHPLPLGKSGSSNRLSDKTKSGSLENGMEGPSRYCGSSMQSDCANSCLSHGSVVFTSNEPCFSATLAS